MFKAAKQLALHRGLLKSMSEALDFRTIIGGVNDHRLFDALESSSTINKCRKKQAVKLVKPHRLSREDLLLTSSAGSLGSYGSAMGGDT